MPFRKNKHTHLKDELALSAVVYKRNWKARCRWVSIFKTAWEVFTGMPVEVSTFRYMTTTVIN